MLRGRAIPLLLAAATLIPIGALAWLGVRILGQDQDVERQRQRENLEVAAGRLAIDIDRRLDDIEDQLAHGSGISLSAEGPKGAGLLYSTGDARGEDVAAAFAKADLLEFQQKDYAAAAVELRKLALSQKAAVRAAAWNRLGRVSRQAGRNSEALAAYDELGRMEETPVQGQPAALLARQARCNMYEAANDMAHLRVEALALATALYAGGWQIGKSTFDLYSDLLSRWGAPPPPAAAMERTEAAIAFWRAWRAGDTPARGRRIVTVAGTPVLVVWTGGPKQPGAWFGPADDVTNILRPLWQQRQLTASILDLEGKPMIGAPEPSAVSLNPGQTRLPFILSVATAPGAINDGYYSRREAFLAGGLLLILTFSIAAAYGLYRVTTREMALGRQQADFVSAVSHEFRTPLTSMRHLTELLVTNSVGTETRKAQYYKLLSGETERLHRMVESLLSFGRIEAGAYAWNREPTQPGDLLPEVLEAFRQDPQSQGRELLCEVDEGIPAIDADREALSHALRNLLENAGKYSEPHSPIRVFAQRGNGSVLLGVEDHGIGIPPQEQAGIFQKFVRGSDARKAGIRGVGIGLALVKRIAEAHGGSVRLRSEPGHGSTFTLVLPCRES
jgi:signal transduction histidine kinase